jgi:hypothetical protein
MTIGDQIVDLPRCDNAVCDRPGVFGYRDQYGTLVWCCAQHRLAQFWADARVPSLLAEQNGASSNDSADQQAYRAAAESAGRGLPKPLDVPPWDRPSAIVDRQLVRRAAGSLSRPEPVAANRAPRFDEAGRFIHPCQKCGRDAFFGIGVNLRSGQLGTWFCDECKPQAKPWEVGER